MKIQFANQYEGDKRKSYPFPSDNMPQKVKDDRKYFLNATQAIIARYVNNLCELPYGAFEGRETIETLRAFANGKQGSERYKDKLIGPINPNTNCRPKNTWNIDWRPIDIIPKKLNDVKGYMQKLKYDIVTSAIDPMAVFSKDMVKAAAKLASDDMMRLLHMEINDKAGGMAVNPDGQLIGQTAGAVPFQNPQQVESFAAIGGIQLSQEIAMKILLDKTQYDSVSDVLNDIIIDDLMQVGICGRKYYCEPGTDSVLWDAISIEGAIIPWSKYADFRDASYFGQVKTITIGELRKISNLEDADYIEIAEKYNTADCNKQYRVYNVRQAVADCQDQGLGIDVLDSIMVDIGDVQWLGTKDKFQTSIRRKKEGNLAINKVTGEYVLTEGEKAKGKKLDKFTKQVIYECKMIIGTDYIFDYGEAKNTPYKRNDKNKKVPVWSYSFYKLTGPSLCEKLIGFQNDANMALFKKRMLIKNLGTGPNIKINESALRGVKIDGVLQSPSSLISLFTDEGFLIVDDKNPWGNQTGGSRPIDIIPSDVIERLMALQREIDSNLQMIEYVSGLNSIFSAATPTSETGLGVAKIAVNATENSIFTIIKAYENQFEQGLKINAHMWKVKAAYMEDSKRDNFATDRAMKYIRIGKEIAFHDFDIKLEAGFTDEEKLMLLQKATQLADIRRQSGTGGIKPSDELAVFEIVKTGNIKLARVVLASIEEHRQAEDEKIAEKRYQENAQLQQQSNKQASENKQAEIQSEGQVQTNIELAKIQAQIQLEEIKGRNKLKEISVANVYGWGADNYNKKVKN